MITMICAHFYLGIQGIPLKSKQLDMGGLISVIEEIKMFLICIVMNSHLSVGREVSVSVSGSGTHDGAHSCSIAMISNDLPCRVQINNRQLPSVDSLLP